MRATPRVMPPPPIAATPPTTRVWLVDRAGDSETYSNGLRIDNSFAVANRPREVSAGIVFHATESAQAPFESEHNEDLKRIGESLLDYIRRRRSYHFVVDRFGRVFRVVRESDAANHAGHSVWADARELYAGLNDSFLGVAFEARTGITAAQVRSGAMLTEMLRSAYAIPAENCVTHAQVSVNPSNMRMGYHVDWASGLPFAGLGLPDNYAIPPAAIWAFGFEADDAFRTVAGEPLRRAIDAARSAVQPGGKQRYRAISTSGRKKNTIPRMR
jgi:N-acetylmuramoyl-L-alanine amidase